MAVEKIESNNDLLMSMLVRLPPKSVFRFRCVSKRWNDIVVDPFFIQSYETRKREELFCSKGLMTFIQTKTYVTLQSNWSFDYSCVSETWQRNKIFGLSNDRNKDVPRKFGHWLHSSNGLILCGRHPNTYFVLNPIVNTCVSLPPPPRLSVQELPSMGLVCEENTRNLVPNYEVVKARLLRGANFLPIQTYSSKTREWTHSTLVCTENFRIDPFKPLFVFNGVFHWFTWHNRSLVVYDSNGCDNNIQLIVLPYNNVGISSTNVTLSFSDGILWYVAHYFPNECLELWMLPKDQNGGYKRSATVPENEWILMHTITDDSLLKDIGIGNIHFFSVELLWLFPCGKAVFMLEGMICLYNLETKSVESFFYVVDLKGWLRFPMHFYTRWYMEPLSLSAFALSPKAY